MASDFFHDEIDFLSTRWFSLLTFFFLRESFLNVL